MAAVAEEVAVAQGALVIKQRLCHDSRGTSGQEVAGVALSSCDHPSVTYLCTVQDASLSTGCRFECMRNEMTAPTSRR
jgi:hypothetical protein